MFTAEERDGIRTALIAAAHADQRIVGAALTGGLAVGRQDDWSDIDLAWSISADLEQVIADWTGRMYAEHGAVHHVDVRRGAVLYRVFLLANTLQVDLSFWPDTEFGAKAATFRLLFGTANELPWTPRPDAVELIGLGWLYALHVRSSIARARLWQAEYMLGELRNQVLALACLRHGLPTVEGRGSDDLPAAETAALHGSLPRALRRDDLRDAFQVLVEALLREARQVDGALAERLAAPVAELADLTG